MHPELVRRLTHPYFEWRRGSTMTRALHSLERSQWLSPEALREMQWTRLRGLMAYAYERVPFYRAAFDRAGLLPQDVRSPADVARLPVVSKPFVRDHGRELIAEREGELLRRRTSGSTGIPMQSYIDRACQGWWFAAIRRSRGWWGLRIGDRDARLVNHRVARAHHLKLYYLLNHMLIQFADLSDDRLDRLYHQLMRFRPDCIRGGPATLERFAQFLVDRARVGHLRPKVVFCTADVLYAPQRTLISEVFGCPVVNEYGSGENGLIAAECREGRLHINAENVYLEYLPLDGGAGNEDIKEIVITDLHNRAMPLIRYRIGDLGVPSSEVCPCGRGLPVLDLKAGRTADLVVLPGGRLMVHSVLCAPFQAGDLGVKQFRIVQEALDRFTVFVVADRPETIARRINDDFARILGMTPTIDVRIVTEIAPERSGKLRRFISKVAKPSREAGDLPDAGIPCPGVVTASLHPGGKTRVS